MMRHTAVALAMVAGLALSAAARAQSVEWPSLDVRLGWDSGAIPAPAVKAGPVVVWETTVEIPGASWLRLVFDEVQLAGVIEEGSASMLRITSLENGDKQYLNAESIEQWAFHTAHFAGSGVHVELLAHPEGAGASRIVIATAIAGIPTGPVGRSICDGVDLRQLSNDPRVARHSTGCTMWLFNDTNRMLGTAGHCGATNSHSAHFNVPLSNSSGTPQPAHPNDQYPVEGASAQGQSGGVGQDWMYFAAHRNSNTGLTAYQAQGAHFTLAASAPPVSGQQIRITGCGTTSAPVSPTWNQAQKTHVGPYSDMTGTTVRYRTDTTGGNSGSPVINENTGEVIGVHTHAGCTSTGGANQGTAAHHAGWRNALANPLGLARSGRGTVTPPLYVIGDMVNNFGTANMTTGNFAKIEAVGAWMQGLAYDPDEEVFYAVNHNPNTNARQLYSINPQTGASTVLGPISGTTSVINGLGFDPTTSTLYGIAQANGQLFRIDVDGANVGLATPIGAPSGGTVAGLEFNRYHMTLHGLDRSTTPARLVSIDPNTGQRTIIGSLGGNISNVSGLGATDEGDLFTIDAANGNLVRVDPATGLGTVIGPSDGVFGASYGMSAVIPPGPAPALRMTFPGGLPFLIPPSQGYEVTVNIEPGTQNVQAGSPRVHYRAQGTGQFLSLPLSHVSGHVYSAVLPAFTCGDTPQIYFSAQGDGGGTTLLPRNAPDGFFATSVGVITTPAVLETTFAAAWPSGWSATGLWHVTTGCLPPMAAACSTGPFAYFGRAATCNYNLPTGAPAGNLNAPQIVLPTLPPTGEILLRFCYALETENSPNFDKAELFVNGQTRPEWRLPDVVPTPTEPDRYWRTAEFDLSEFEGQAVSLSWRFTGNSINNAFRGWHIDKVIVTATAIGCEQSCYANCDGSTVEPILNIDDFTCFINNFAEGQSLPPAQQVTHYANCDGSTTAPVLNIDDFTCFINSFAQGCP